MSDTLLTGLLQNVAILLAVTFLYDIIWANETAYRSRRNQLMTGLVLGCVAILLMLTNWEFSPGLVFDSRSILMVNVGLFFGPVATVAAIVVAGTYRLFMGGPGVWMGIASIVFSAATGLVWKWLRPEWRKGEAYCRTGGCRVCCPSADAVLRFFDKGSCYPVRDIQENVSHNPFYLSSLFGVGGQVAYKPDG